MYYEFAGNNGDNEQFQAAAMISLVPAESKRLIARAVVALPEIQAAKKKGRIYVRVGTTNAFIAEELLGIKFNKAEYTSGIITSGELATNNSDKKIGGLLLINGEPTELGSADPIADFDAGDVLIKGANAIDPEGNAGVLIGSEVGIGSNQAVFTLRGFHLIVPVGLEKLVASVPQIANRVPGILRTKYCTGMPVAFFPIINGKVLTEIQALRVLCGVSAYHMASGGVGGSEGSVVLSALGSELQIENMMNLIKSIKDEPQVPAPSKMKPLAKELNYNVSEYCEKLSPGRGPIPGISFLKILNSLESRVKTD